MTLFVRMPNRAYEINDAYIMALSFCLFFAIAQIVKEVLKKQEAAKDVKMPNPTGGSMKMEFTDDSELALTILTCIADNEVYIVRHPKIRELVFGLVKEKIKNESLLITPNMIRFLALKLLDNDKGLMIRLGSIIVLSDNRVRFLSRLLGASILGFVGNLLAVFPYALMMAVLYFDCTENCGYQCHDYFEHISKEGPAIIYAEKPFGNLVVGQNDDSRQIEIYIPSKVPDEVIIHNNKDATIRKSYKKSRKKAKEMQFSEFKKKDPVLSSFKNLEEPHVSQKHCLMDDIHDVIGIE